MDKQEKCGVLIGSDEYGWRRCVRPKGHLHDGARYGLVASGNHSETPLPQDQS